MINLHVICNNQGCTSPRSRGYSRCRKCIREGIDLPSGTDYGKVQNRLVDYLMRNWSNNRVVLLNNNREDSE